MADEPLIMWDGEFPLHRIDEGYPEYAAFCIAMSECMISDGADVHDVLVDAIGSVTAYACDIPEEDVPSWMLMLEYGARMFGDIGGGR